MNKEQVAGTYRVLRGGSWGNSADYCRAADRSSYDDPAISSINLGFRSCRKVTPKDKLKEFKELMEEGLFNE